MSPEHHRTVFTALIVTVVLLASVFFMGAYLHQAVRRGRGAHKGLPDQMVLLGFGRFASGMMVVALTGVTYLLLVVSVSPLYVSPTKAQEQCLTGLLTGGLVILLANIVWGVRFLYKSVQYDRLERRSWRKLLSGD